MKTRLLLMSLAAGFASLLFAQVTTAADITIKFAHNSPARMDASFHRYFVHFSELAKKYTNGKVEFQEFPASQMGSDQQAAKKLQLGLIQMMEIATTNIAQLYSGFDLFTLPFLVKSMDCGIKHVLVDDKLLHDISEGAEKKANIRVLAFDITGMRNMMNSKHPIMLPSDLKGLRIRVAKNQILLDTYHQLGADVIGVASAETYGALQTHMVDGADGGAGWVYAQKLYETQKYYSITNHVMGAAAIIVNNKFYKSLPKDVQAGLDKAAKEAALNNMLWAEGYQNKIYQSFKKAGLEIDHPDLTSFRDAVKPVLTKYADRVGGMQRIEYVETLQKTCN